MISPWFSVRNRRAPRRCRAGGGVAALPPNLPGYVNRGGVRPRGRGFEEEGNAMALRSAAALTGVTLLALTGGVAAQVPLSGPLPSFETAPAAPPPGTGPAPATGAPGARGAPPPGARAAPQAGPEQEPPCFKEFVALRQEAQKKANLINAAKDRKPPPTREEMCQVVKNFAAAEEKVIKFVVTNQESCGIPGEAITQMKAGAANTTKFRTAVCTGGGGPGPAAKAAPPPGPKLSDELGIRGIAGPTESSSGRGTFDTLTGSPLQR